MDSEIEFLENVLLKWEGILSDEKPDMGTLMRVAEIFESIENRIKELICIKKL